MIKQIKRYASHTRSYIDGLNRINPNIIVFIAYGLLFDTVINVWKPFAIKFLQLIEGGEFLVSLFYSLPGIIAAVSLLPGSIFIARLKKKKRFTSILFFISRSILLITAFVPLLPPGIRPLVFVLLISVMNFPDAVSQTSLQSFLGEVFDGRVRSQAISMRNKFGNVVVPMVTLLTGFIISYLPGSPAQRLLFYQAFFVVAFLVGMIEISMFQRFKEKDDAPDEIGAEAAEPRRADLATVKKVFADKKFTRFLSTTMVFTFFWQAGWPLCGIYQIKNLGASEIWLAIFTVASSIGAFSSAGFWTRTISRKGNAKALFLAAALIAGNLFLFPFAPNLIVMALVSFYSGFAVLGINTCLLNGLLDATADDNRVVYLGVYNTCANISLFISPFAAHVLNGMFGIRIALVLLAVGRFLGSFLILLIKRGDKE